MILRMVRVALLRGCKDSKKICFSRRGILGWLPFLLFNVDGRAVGEDDAVGGIEGFQAHLAHTNGDDMIGKKLSTI